MSFIHKGVECLFAENQEEWRTWLMANHNREKPVWLILYKKNSAKKKFGISEAIDEALCFGWIDSKSNTRDSESYYVYFSKRNAKSNWSAINKAKIDNLIYQGKMHGSGLKMIEMAKLSGTWDALNDVENLVIPKDLQILFDKNPIACTNWQNFSRSLKRSLLEWIFNAKREETRSKRINVCFEKAVKNEGRS